MRADKTARTTENHALSTTCCKRNPNRANTTMLSAELPAAITQSARYGPRSASPKGLSTLAWERENIHAQYVARAAMPRITHTELLPMSMSR